MPIIDRTSILINALIDISTGDSTRDLKTLAKKALTDFNKSYIDRAQESIKKNIESVKKSNEQKSSSWFTTDIY